MTDNADNPKSVAVALKYGTAVDGADVKTMTMRPPLARDSRDAQRGSDGPADMEIKLIANLCAMAPETIEELHMADYVLLQKAYSDFLA